MAGPPFFHYPSPVSLKKIHSSLEINKSIKSPRRDFNQLPTRFKRFLNNRIIQKQGKLLRELWIKRNVIKLFLKDVPTVTSHVSFS